MAEPCHFQFYIFGPCLPITSGEKKNTNRAAGLSNQGGWAVAGLKQRQPHLVESFHECFDELHNSVELIETVSRVRARHKRKEET